MTVPETTKVLTIIVGIESYDIKGAELPAARKQASLIAQQLAKYAGPQDRMICLLSPAELNPPIADVIVEPATHDSIFRVFTRDVLQAEGDLLIVVWCGHGMLGEDQARRLFVSNASEHSYLNIGFDSLQKFLASAEVKFSRQILLVDACANWDQGWMSRRSLPASEFSWSRQPSSNQQFILFGVAKNSVTNFGNQTSVFGEGLLSALDLQRLTADSVVAIANHTREFVLEKIAEGKVDVAGIPVISRKDWNEDERLESNYLQQVINANLQHQDLRQRLALRANLYRLTEERGLLPDAATLRNFRKLSDLSDDQQEFINAAQGKIRDQRFQLFMAAAGTLAFLGVICVLIYVVWIVPLRQGAANGIVSAILELPDDSGINSELDRRSERGVTESEVLNQAESSLAMLIVDEADTPDEVKYQLDKHRGAARLYLVLGALGNHDALIKALADLDHPTTRTRIIRSLHLVFEIDEILLLLGKAIGTSSESPAAEQAILLALGDIAPHMLASQQVEGLTLSEWLQRRAYFHRDAGIRSAALWVLLGMGKLNSQTSLAPVPDANWYIDEHGHTMIKFATNQEYWMGGDNRSRSGGDAPRHRRRIPRAFSIAACECTVDQYMKYFDDANQTYADRPTWRPNRPAYDGTSPDGRQPIQNVNWIDAARYCNWLSRRSDLLPCYEEMEIEGARQQREIRIVVPGDICDRDGYRLPTEAEWEFACRGGTDTVRALGNDKDQVRLFAHINARRPCRVGSLRPNAYGFFDLHGNIAEWCHSDFVEYQIDRAGPIDDLCWEQADGSRVVRGGSYKSQASEILSAARFDYPIAELRSDRGFRVARTEKK